MSIIQFGSSIINLKEVKLIRVGERDIQICFRTGDPLYVKHDYGSRKAALDVIDRASWANSDPNPPMPNVT